MRVSVIIATYNADFDKLIATVNSILVQDYSDKEIVFADDGSSIKWNEKIVEYMKEKGEKNYLFADSPENVGTVANVFNAVRHANGEYIKFLSPGDMLYDSSVLSKWVDDMEIDSADVSFGDAVYYSADVIRRIVIQRSSPANPQLFEKKEDSKKLFVNYLVANDTILGASIMARRSIVLEYLGRIVNHVKYAEDYEIRLMVFEGIVVKHFRMRAIWYEYGLGISTGKNEKWTRLLQRDYQESNKLILSSTHQNERLQKKYVKLLSREKYDNRVSGKLKYILFPSALFFRYMVLKHPTYTQTGDIDILNSFFIK